MGKLITTNPLERVVKDPIIKELSHNKTLYKKVFISNGELQHVTQVAASSFSKGDSISEHIHETMSEIFYVVRGKVQIFFNNKTDEARESELFVIPIKTKHSLLFLEDTELFYFGIAEYCFFIYKCKRIDNRYNILE